MLKYLYLFILIFIFSNTWGQDYQTNSEGATNFPKDSYDLNDYSKVPIVKSISDCFHKSYVYYFSVGNDKFRVVHIRTDTFPQTATVQKFVSNKWQNRIEFYDGNKLNNFYIKDINKDGFIDIVRETYFESELYFFKPSINDFIDTVCGILNYDIYLIDTLHNIYCDFQEYRQNCGNITSTLYTFKNYSKYYLYNLELYNCANENDHTKITKLILYKCLNGSLKELKEIKTFKLKHPLSTEKEKYFDNKAFWKREYLRLNG